MAVDPVTFIAGAAGFQPELDPTFALERRPASSSIVEVGAGSGCPAWLSASVDIDVVRPMGESYLDVRIDLRQCARHIAVLQRDLRFHQPCAERSV